MELDHHRLTVAKSAWSGRIDGQCRWSAQLQDWLKTADPDTVLPAAFRVPRRQELQTTRRILARVDPERDSSAMARLARDPLPHIWQFLIGCRDLTLVLLASDSVGSHVNCSGDVSDISSLIRRVLLEQPADRPADAPWMLAPAQHWSTTDRLDRTCAAVEQLLESLGERRDLCFVAAWELPEDIVPTVQRSLGVPLEFAVEQLAVVDRRFLAGESQSRCVSVNDAEEIA